MYPIRNWYMLEEQWFNEHWGAILKHFTVTAVKAICVDQLNQLILWSSPPMSYSLVLITLIISGKAKGKAVPVHAIKVHKERRYICTAALILDPCTIWRWWSTPCTGCIRTIVPTVQEAGWAWEQLWRRENLKSTSFMSLCYAVLSRNLLITLFSSTLKLYFSLVEGPSFIPTDIR